MSGTALAGSLPEPRPFVVFATAFDRYALDAFAVDATDYLVKPITRARLAGTSDARARAAVAPIRHRARSRCRLGAQAMLLPRTLPTIDGYESAAVTLPARGVGGDFFVSAANRSASRFVVALGDVSGKGMPAGTRRVESAGDGWKRRRDTPRLGGRHRVRRESRVVSDLRRARFATLAYVESRSRESSRLTVVNAGHLPASGAQPRPCTQFSPSTGPASGHLARTRTFVRGR